MKGSVLYALHDHPMLQPRGEMDSAVYVQLAAHPTSEPYFVSPLYIYFLRLTGLSLFGARVLQILFGSVAVVLIFDTARLWFGDRAATIGAVLAILCGVISFYEVTILQAALDPFLVALTLWLLARALTSGDRRLFVLTGVALGLFVLNRPNAVLFVPVVLVVAIFEPRRHGEHGGFSVSSVAPWFLLLGLAAAIAPVTIRNYIVSHKLILIASHGGLNFYIGNNPQADGTYHHVEGVRPTIGGQAEDAPRVEAKYGSFYKRAFDWIRSEPGAAFALFLRKIAYTFNQADLALNYSYAYFWRDVRSPLRFLIAGPWLLFPLGLVGGVLMLRDREFAIWATFIPVYAISVAIFFVSSRYRMPLLIPMCICASAMFVKPRLIPWIAAGVLAIGVCWNFHLDEGRAHERTNMIVVLIDEQRFDEAAQLIASTEAMTRDPVTLHRRAAGAYRDAAIRLVQSNQPEQALAAFEAAHRLDPSDASNVLNIAVLEAERGDIDAAREHAREALRLRPGYPQAEGLLRALQGQ